MIALAEAENPPSAVFLGLRRAVGDRGRARAAPLGGQRLARAEHQHRLLTRSGRPGVVRGGLWLPDAMTRIGTSDLDVRPLNLGGNVFGWTADEATSHAVLDAFVEAAATSSTPPTCTPPGRRRRRDLRDHHRELAGEVRQARPGRHRHQGRQQGGPQGPGRRQHPQGRRRVAAAPADRPHRPVLGPPGRQGHPAGRDPRRLRRARHGRQGPRDRRLELLRGPAHRGPGDLAPRGLRQLRRRAEPLQPRRARGVRARRAARVEANGLASLPYFSLASGFLTGKYRPGQLADSQRQANAAAYLDSPRGPRVLEALDTAAAAHGVDVATVALAWLRSQPTVVAPIASARTVEQLPALLASMDLELTAEELSALDHASASGKLTAHRNDTFPARAAVRTARVRTAEWRDEHDCPAPALEPTPSRVRPPDLVRRGARGCVVAARGPRRPVRRLRADGLGPAAREPAAHPRPGEPRFGDGVAAHGVRPRRPVCSRTTSSSGRRRRARGARAGRLGAAVRGVVVAAGTLG